MTFIGEVAGLLTSLCFTGTAIFLSRAAGQVGAMVVNRARVVIALVFLVVLNLIFYRQLLPFDAGLNRWLWLGISGVIGLAIGDAFLFQAFTSIGPRLGLLLLSLSTVFGVLEAWLFFGEVLHLGEIAGIALALAGMAWVIWENGTGPNERGGAGLGSARAEQNGRSRPAPTISISGIAFGILAALGQATGLVFSKQGMLGSFSPISGNLIRMLAAAIALWLMAALQKQAGSTVSTLRANPGSLRLLALAALIGPVAGVSLSLLAVQNTAVGVASVLTSLAPIFMLPFSHFVLKERLGWQAVAGTLLAMIGVVILFLT